MGFLTGLSLGRKIALLAAAGMLAGIGLFSFLAMRAVRQSVDTMLEDRLTLARLTADYIDDTLAYSLSQVEATAQRIDARSGEGGVDEHVAGLESVLAHQSIRMSGAYVVDTGGAVLWSKVPPEGGPTSDTAFLAGVSGSLPEGRASVSGLVMSPVLGVPSVLLVSGGVAVNGGEGTLVAAVDIGQSGIAGLVQPVRLGDTGYIEIVDQNGIVVARTEPGPRLGVYETSDHSERFASLIEAGTATRGVCHSCHEPVARVQARDVLAFVPLSEANWGVVVRQSEAEAFAPIQELRQNLLAAGAGLVLITSVIITVITRDVVSRTRLLTSASRRIAGGDLVTPIQLARQDELGVLARSLDEMRTKLRSSYEELEQRTGELSALLSVSDVLAPVPSQADLETALGAALDKTMRITKADAVGILLWDEERQAFCYRAHSGLSQQYVDAVCCRPGEGIAGRVAESTETILVEDISTDSRAIRTDLVVAEGLKGFASVPLRSKRSTLGVLNVASREVRRFSPHDVRLLESIGGQIATALENVRLHEEVQRKDEMRRELLREVLAMQEEDRKRIARELHDETSQVLAGLTANLEAIAGMLPDGDGKAVRLVKKTEDLSVKILDEIHRLIYELRPSLLDDMGLVSAARWLAENNLEPAGVAVEFRTVGKARRLAPDLEVTLFRVIQEAMNNITRHAGARKARVVLNFRKASIVVQVSDDGRGFDVDEAINAKDRPRGLGLLGMRERVELVNGTIDIRSEPGGGTLIEVKIPIREEANDGKDKSAGG
jgi:signal transduction histidine kinase